MGSLKVCLLFLCSDLRSLCVHKHVVACWVSGCSNHVITLCVVINLDENVQTSLFGNYELNNAVETMCWANPESEDLVCE